MTDDNDAGGFAPPPFDPAAALATLRRSARDLKLAEREGRFELRGLPVAQASVDGAELSVQLARRLLRTPEWERHTVKNHADLRRFTELLKKRLAQFADARGEDR